MTTGVSTCYYYVVIQWLRRVVSAVSSDEHDHMKVETQLSVFPLQRDMQMCSVQRARADVHVGGPKWHRDSTLVFELIYPSSAAWRDECFPAPRSLQISLQILF